MHVSVASGTALSFFSVCNTSPPPSLQLAFCGMSPLTSRSVTRVLWGMGESHNVTSPLVTRVTHVFWRKCQSYNFTSAFYLEEWHAFCEVWVTWPNIALYLQCSLVNIWLSSSFETSRDSCEARFPLEKETTSGRGWPYHMRIRCDLWTQDAVYMRKHNEREPEQCGRVPSTRFFCEKHKVCGSGRPRVISIYSNIERKTRFTWENTRNLEGLVRKMIRNPGAAGRITCKSTITLNARRNLFEKTQRISTARIFIEKQTSRRGLGHPWHIVTIKMKPRHIFFCWKQKDFSGVGGNDM